MKTLTTLVVVAATTRALDNWMTLRTTDDDDTKRPKELEAWCSALKREPPLARQPCWGAPELKRRSGTHRAYTLAEKLRRGATSSDGAAIFPSEAGQDAWLWRRHLRHLKREIVYVDIGSNDFLHTSESYFLDACAQARGVCVEASQAYVKDYEDYGRTCKVYNDCLGATPQTIEWVEYGKGSGSTRSGVLTTNKSWRARIRRDHATVTNRTCTTGRHILEKENIRHVDWLQIDVEGHELEVLKGFDFASTTIDVVSIESNLHSGAPYYLEKLGYTLAHRIRVTRGHVDEFWIRRGFAFLGQEEKKVPCARPGEAAFLVDPHTLMKGKWGKHGFLTEAEHAAIHGRRLTQCSQRLLACSLRIYAGFGFRLGVLNGCLRAANALNATLLYTPDLYRRGQGYGISEKSDKLLRLAEALPREECGERIAVEGPETARADFDAWSLPSSLPDTGVLELKARSSERRHGDAPFLSHDYRETAAWLRQRFLSSKAYLPLQHFSGGISVALHVRNGDRLPGKRYAKHARLNLGDDYYVGVVKALQSISSVDVVAFGASVAAKKSSELLDAHGNVSRIPAEVPDAKVVLDGDPLEALTHMARADVLVAARSQFSYAAIALARGVVIHPSKWHAHRQSVPRFPEDRAHCHVPASDSGAIDRDRLAAALRACRIK